MSTFNGKNITVEIFGQSHSDTVGVTAKGFPSFKFDAEKLNKFLARRKANGQVYSTARVEPDTPVFDGVVNGQVNGSFTAVIHNVNL